MRKIIGFVFFAIVGIVLIFNGLKSGRRQKELNPEGRPADYANLINRTGPGDNWKSIEATTMRDLIESRRMKTGSDSLDSYWSERGPANIPGRITDIKIDYRLGLIYCLSDHGLVFKGNMDGTGWKSLNDQHPLAEDVGCYLEIIQMADHTRILVGGWQKTLDGWGVFYSDDDGATCKSQPDSFNTRYQASGEARLPVMLFICLFRNITQGYQPTTIPFINQLIRVHLSRYCTDLKSAPARATEISKVICG